MDALPLQEKVKIDLVEREGGFVAVVEAHEGRGVGLAPLSPGMSSPLPPGTRVRGTFLAEGRICSFDSEVLAGPPPRLWIARPAAVAVEEVECYQRAGFTGIEGFVPLRYEIVTRGEMADLLLQQRGGAVWLGGDSLVMVNMEAIPVRTLLAVRLELPFRFGGAIHLFGKVARVESKGELFEMEVEFDNVREHDRDMILTYVLARQAELRRRAREKEEVEE